MYLWIKIILYEMQNYTQYDINLRTRNVSFIDFSVDPKNWPRFSST